MNLQDKIYQNIVDQFKNIARAERVRNLMAELDRSSSTSIGRMSILSEIYQEQTGRDLQKDLNEDPAWKEKIQKAKAEAESAVASENIPGFNTQSNPAPVRQIERHEQQQPTMRKIAGNKKPVEINDAEDSEPTPPLQPRTNIGDRQNPIKISIDDEPAQPPSDAIISDYDDD